MLKIIKKMKNFKLSFCCAVLIIFTKFCFSENHFKIAIIEFININTNYSISKTLTEIFRSQLSKVPDIDIIEREQLQKVIEEQKLNLSDFFNDTDIVEVGKFVGATHILTGTLSLISNKYILNLRLINVKTTKIDLGQSYELSKDNFFENSLEIINNLINLFKRPKVTASSCINIYKYGPEKAIDNDYSTSWIAASNNYKGWLLLEYKRPMKFSKIEIYCDQPEFARGMPKEFVLEYYTGRDWKIAVEVMSNKRGIVKKEFLPKISKKWRLRIDSVINKREPLQIAEIVLK